MAMKRILFYTHEFPLCKAGAATFAFDIVDGLSKKRQNPIVVLAPCYCKQDKSFDERQIFNIVRMPLTKVTIINYLIGSICFLYGLARFKPGYIFITDIMSQRVASIISLFIHKRYFILAHGSEILANFNEGIFKRKFFTRIYSKCQKIIANSKEHQKKLMLATKVNTLKEQEIINEDFRKYAKQSLIENSIMPVLENFERALNIETDDSKLQNFLKGFQYVFDSLKDSLKKEGLHTINIKPGDLFDSHKCEAVETEWVEELASDEKDNMIIKILVSGYQLHSRVIKPAKVKIIKLKTDNKKNDTTTIL